MFKKLLVGALLILNYQLSAANFKLNLITGIGTHHMQDNNRYNTNNQLIGLEFKYKTHSLSVGHFDNSYFWDSYYWAYTKYFNLYKKENEENKLLKIRPLISFSSCSGYEFMGVTNYKDRLLMYFVGVEYDINDYIQLNVMTNHIVATAMIKFKLY